MIPRLFAASAALVAIAQIACADSAGRLSLTVGEGELITLSQPAETVFVADPSVADVQVASPKSVFLFGASSGKTTFYALDAEGRPLAKREIHVVQDLTTVHRVLAERFPGMPIRISPGPKSVMVSGKVGSPEQVEAIIATVTGAVPEGDRVINQLRVADPVQVTLRVRVAEVSRSADKRLGINWSSFFNDGAVVFGLQSALGITAAGSSSRFSPLSGTDSAITAVLPFGNFNIAAMLDALNQDGLARTLAEPNLTATSGETASFIAGGEFPIPMPAKDNEVQVEYKKYGVMLDFTPTVLSPNRISLRVRPEVSELTNSGAVQANGLTLPALTVRRVDTTVELASGQSLVIGGLLKQNGREQLNKIPGLGDLPVLGALFTSSQYLNDETELVIMVTPYLVGGVASASMPTPISPRSHAGALEILLAERAGLTAPPKLHGPVGFSY